MSAMPGPLKLVGSGRHADVYDLGDGRVLRRYRDVTAVADREAAVMAHALAHGVPVPEVFDVSGPDIVMERAAGPTMLQDVTRRPWALDSHARLLAALHSMVHAVPALSWLRAPFGAGTALLHTDLHPGNVILTRAGPRLIDWQGAASGPAEADIALTWVLVATSQIPGPPVQRAVGRAGQALFARRYLAAVQPLAPCWLAAAAGHRLRDRTVRASEAAMLHRLLESGRLASRGPDR
jgi:aminoglycoside phosphotransferase (APT) family kinase protein